MKLKKTLHVTSGGNWVEVTLNMVSSLEEGVYDIIIMDKEGARSHDQNSLLWGVIYKGLSIKDYLKLRVILILNYTIFCV